MKKRIFDEKIRFWEVYINSLIFCLGIFEAGHLAGLLLGWPLSFCGNLILIMLAVSGLAVIFLLVKSRERLFGHKRDSIKNNKSVFAAFVVFGGLFILQTIYIWREPILQTAGDITLETVNSFLVSDSIYEVSPLTGREYSGGPLRYEILCLPTVYSLLSRWLRIQPAILVTKVIPVVTLCTTYGAYYLLSGTLFGKQKESLEKRIWFLVIISIIFFLSEGSVYTEGYGVLHGGYLGTTIRNSILVPFLIYAVLERRWIAVAFCLLAEVCIVWTFWGLGVCAAVLAVMKILEQIRRKRIYERMD